MDLTAYAKVRKKASTLRKKPILKTAILKVSDIPKPLSVKPEESDFKWHADLIGWPSNGKDEQKYLAMELAKIATLET